MVMSQSAHTLISFDDYELDLQTGELRRNGVRVRLASQPSRILALLARRAGEIVGRGEIIQHIWGSETFVDFDQGLNFAIRQIRTALNDDAEHPKYVETVPKLGYRFIVPLSQPGGTSGAIPPQRKIRLTGFTALTGVLLAVGSALLFLHFRGKPHVETDHRIRSLVVLPLQNLSGDSAQEYFVEGMTDELTTDLAQIGNLRVVSRTSAMHYAGTQKRSPEIGRELQVDALIEGSVARSGNRVRIRAQLIDAASDRHLWAKTYDRDLNDVLQLQSAVAEDIASQIQLELTAQEKARLTSARQVNPEAYEAYLRGRYFWNRRTEEALRKAMGYFEQAIAKDPSYAEAYAGIADTYNMLGNWGAVPPGEAYPRAKTAAQEALLIDGRLADAQVALTFARFLYDHDWTNSDDGFKRAIELNANYAPAHQWYGVYLISRGQREEAVAEARRAEMLDPQSLIVSAVVGWIYYLGHEYGRTVEQCQKTLEMDSYFYPAHLYLADALAQEGIYDQAEAEYKKAITLSGGNMLAAAGLGHAYGRQGKRQKALQMLTKLSTRSYVPPAWRAMIYAGLGENNQAVMWLEKAYDDHHPWLVLLKVEPEFDSLKADPRFQKLVQKVGIP